MEIASSDNGIYQCACCGRLFTQQHECWDDQKLMDDINKRLYVIHAHNKKIAYLGATVPPLPEEK